MPCASVVPLLHAVWPAHAKHQCAACTFVPSTPRSPPVLQPEGHADVPYVMFASNRGRTYRLWENRYHRTVLRQWGMRASDAFRCGFHFLLRPNQATQVGRAGTHPCG